MDDVQLAEYSSLRDEELKCMGAQHDLVKLDVTASATVAALAIAKTPTPGLLVILAFLSPLLGLLWLDLDAKVHRIGCYVRETLWDERPSWELWVLERKRGERPTRVFAFALPIVGVFLLPAIVGLYVSSFHTEAIGGSGVWIAALAPVVLFAVVGTLQIVERARDQAQR